jgi:chitinase
VPDVNHGMYQKCAGAMHVSNPGDENWNALRKLDYPPFRDPVSHAFWTYSSAEGILWSYDDPASLAEKARYARRRGLAGTMCWELAGDDAGGTLIKTLAESLR